MRTRLKAILITLLVQLTFAGLYFVGFLLDPLLGIVIDFLYFAVVGSVLIYLLVMEKSKV